MSARRVSFSAQFSNESSDDPQAISATRTINFGLLVVGRCYRATCSVSLSPLACEVLDEDPDPGDGDIADNPPIICESSATCDVRWVGPLLLGIELVATECGNISETFKIGDTDFAIKAKIMNKGMGTPLLRRGIRRRDSRDLATSEVESNWSEYQRPQFEDDDE
eukprot:c32269_g1_i1.p1 GENE.c32269_g1_i1~~c32269_g1_i1.p1  ORF type:complete len:165 (+),score=35.93 c32269_g1_i1:50-544(+)